MRLKPRYNPEVNDWWLCDDGRYNYSFIDQDRLRCSTVLSAAGRDQIPMNDGIQRLAEQLRQIPAGQTLLLLSADSSNEEIYAARRLFQDSLGCHCRLPDIGIFSGDQDDFLIREDKHPNTTGVMRIFGWQRDDLLPMDKLTEVLEKENIKLLLVNRHNLPEETLARLDQLECRLVYLGTNGTPTAEAAYLTLPLASFAEKEGTFTNGDGRVQKFNQAFPPLGDAAPEWEIYGKLAERLAFDHAFGSVVAVFDQLSSDISFFQKMKYQEIAAFGELGAHE
jgi:NADH-quinone oxidoreductase subunit G